MTEEGIFLGGGSNPSRYVNQSLPNIKGDWNSNGGGVYLLQANGSFYQTPNSLVRNYSITSMTGYDGYKLGFDASKSSSIYKNGASVMPKHYIVEFYIKYK